MGAMPTLPRDAPTDVERATLQALADGRTVAQIARDQHVRQAIRRGWLT